MFWWWTKWTKEIKPTEKEIQSNCIHIWKDKEITWNTIRQECFRCGIVRKITIN